MNADQLYADACILIQRYNYEKAADKLRRAVSMQPNHLPALHDLAGCCGMLNQWADAEKYYKRVIALDPWCYSAMWNLGVIYFSQKKLDESLAILQETVLKFPTGADAYMAAANTLGAMGRIDEALECDRRACELNPDDPVLWSAYSMRALYSGSLTPQQVAEIHFQAGKQFQKVANALPG